MNIFRSIGRVFSAIATGVKKGSQSGEPSEYGSPSAMRVTEDTALQLSAVWACTKLLCEVFSSLPTTFMTKGQFGKPGVPATHSLMHILNVSPNSRQTPVEYKETMMLNLVLHGNCYARIERNSRGNVIALWPLPAMEVEPVLLDDGSVVYYWYKGNDVVAYADQSILHIKLFGNGLVGLSPIAYARNCLGLAQASDVYASKHFINGGKPSGVLYTDAALNKSQRDKARDNFKDVVEEREESRRLLVLPSGFKYQQIQLSPADMQMLESRKYSTKEICRFFGNVPPVLVGENDGTTQLGSSVEQILIGWYRLGLNPFATRFEQGYAKKLLTPVERTKFEFHVDFDALTRGDSKTEMEYLKGMVGGPIMTPNEGRARKNLPPVADGDTLNPAPTVGKKATDEKGVSNE